MTDRKPVSITDPKTNRTFQVDPETGKAVPAFDDQESTNSRMTRQCREIVRDTLTAIVRHDRAKLGSSARVAWLAVGFAAFALIAAAVAIGASLHRH